MRALILASLIVNAFALGRAQAQRPSPSRVAERARALMQDLADRNLFQGAVVMGRGGRVDYAAGYGFADRERGVPFTPGTPTDGGSIAKTFTAAALLTLVAERRLTLETRVRTSLPSFPHATTRVRHLLSHSAGLPAYEWLDAGVAPGEARTNASHLALIARDTVPPAFRPGSAYAYDNVAYDVAAMLIEHLSGESYAGVMMRRYFGPLRLQAFVRPARFADWTGVRTRGYRRTATGLELHDAYDLEGFHGGGNIYLSAHDLFHWMRGYRRVVPAATRRLALTPARLDDGRTTGLTFGSWYASRDGRRYYYTGHHNGFHTFGYVDELRDLAVAWVANDAPPPWLQPTLSRALIAIAEGREPASLRPPQPVATSADPTGQYRIPGVGEVRLRRDDRRLFVRARGVEYEAFAVPGEVRYVPGLDAYLRLASDARGRVVLTWDSVFGGSTSVLREPSTR